VDRLRSPDFARLKRELKDGVIFDGRNVYDPRTVAAAADLLQHRSAAAHA